jgi:beta-glucosidase
LGFRVSVSIRTFCVHATDPFFFSHGLSYTTFEYSDLKLSTPSVVDGDVKLTATVTVKNTGSVAGSEVVQLYTTIPSNQDPAHIQVPRSLRAFSKVHDLAPGASTTVELALDKYAVSYWEPTIGRWVVENAEYVVEVGPSSAVLPLQATFAIERGFEWNGL